MFSWVVKVVPQPAEAPAAAESVKKNEAKNASATSPEEASEDGQSNGGVMGWLSNGFVSALPQPPGSPLLKGTNADCRPGEDGDRTGVMGWVAQGLTKVLPQPDEKYREAAETQNAAEEHTEVFEAATMPDYDPLPHIPVVEVVSEEEVSEVESLAPQFRPKVVNWIKQIVPQPVILPSGGVPVEAPPKVSRSSLDKVLSPPPESLSGISLDTDSRAGVVDWFVSGLGLKMPQLVMPPKDEAEGATEVLQTASSKLKPDMVLEDMESDNEGQNRPKAAGSQGPAGDPAQQERGRSGSAQVLGKCATQVAPQDPASDSGTKTSQEDAETQTGRWTPFIESIKKEAEGVALASMEERLLLERMEMARLAEEVARQTAEMAVRQMASEGTSIKLSLESQELLEELEEPEEPEELEAELPAAPEEVIKLQPGADADAEKDGSGLNDEQKAEEPAVQVAGRDAAEEQQGEPEPEPEKQEVCAAAVTEQPQKANDGPTPNTEKDEDASGDSCGAPVSCDAFKNCLMRFPPTSECFGNINAFFKENGISPPQLPHMPRPPTRLSDLTSYLPPLPSLPPELRHEFSQIRLTRVPRSVAQSLTQLLPGRGAGDPEAPGGPGLSGLAHSLSSIPEKLTQLPSRTQQSFLNIWNRLNSLMPQDA